MKSCSFLVFITILICPLKHAMVTHRVCWNGTYVQVTLGSSESCQDIVAIVLFRDEINQNGWSFLEIETFQKYDDELQAYSAGFGEGFATKQLIEWHWHNLISDRFECENELSNFCRNLGRVVRANLDWIDEQITSHPHDEYWHQVSLMLTQLAGLEDGFYNRKNKPHRKLSPFGFILLQMLADFGDLSTLLNLPENVSKTLFDGEHCSALIVILPGNKDILFGHVSWLPYETMLRVQKLYKFSYRRNGREGKNIASTAISMSSYPGFLWSYDDFYLLESGLVRWLSKNMFLYTYSLPQSVMETTIGGDGSLWPYVMRNNSVPTWIRTMVANRLASNGKEWAEIFVKWNSGTYNNQYMILDNKNFIPGKSLPKIGMLYLVEQVPSMVEHADITDMLRKQGYWASYNIAYFDSIYNYTSSWIRYQQLGDWFSYQKCPRARIFRRDAMTVTDLESMVHLMRSNNYESDSLSLCENCIPKLNAMNAISARGDLNPKNGTYPFWQLQHALFGGTDLKVTNYKMFQKLQFYAVNGPTYSNQIAPFRWSSYDKGHSRHKGHPDEFKFKSVVNKWNFYVNSPSFPIFVTQ